MGRLNPKATSRNTGWQMLYEGIGAAFPVTKNNLTAVAAMDSVLIAGNTLHIGDLIRIRGQVGAQATSGTPAALTFRATIGALVTGGAQIATANLTCAVPPATTHGLNFESVSRVSSSTALTSLNNGFTNSRINTAEAIGSFPDGFTTTLPTGTFADDQNIFAAALFADALQQCTLHWWTVEVLQ